MNRRISLISGLMAVFAVAIAVHYGRIMLPGDDDPTGLNTSSEIERGPILDRNGRLLAIQTELPTVTAWTPYIDDPEETATQLAGVLSINYEQLLENLSQPNRDIIVKRTITPSEAEVIELLQQQGELQGITLHRDVGRVYPEANSASHVIGFTGIDNNGLEGIELTENSVLSPEPSTPGQSQIYGNQIFLTLDIVIQNRLSEIADALMEEHNPDSVMLMVMDAKTGEFLGYVSKPDYDPNNFSQYDAEARRNRPLQMSYEPGSAFKVFSLSSIMNLGGVDDSTTFNTRGGYTNPNIDIPITDLGNYGVVDPEKIIRLSSNVGAAYASDTVDQESFYQMLRLYGFGQRTGIELNGEAQGILAPMNRWSSRTKPTIAIGQEIGVTALQMMQAATVLANDGVMLKPQIINKIVSPSGQLVEAYGREPVREVLRPGIAPQILQYMLSASGEGGTGRRAAIEGIDMSVKTGTAEVIDPETGSYSDESFIASTLAIFPTEDPEVIVYVVIQHPRGESYLGGRIAAPVVHEVAEFLIPYLQLATPETQTSMLPDSIEISEPGLPIIGETLPNYLGLPLRTVLPLYANERVSAEIRGFGRVVRQDPAPGSNFVAGMSLVLYLSDDPEDSSYAPINSTAPGVTSPGSEDSAGSEVDSTQGDTQ